MLLALIVLLCAVNSNSIKEGEHCTKGSFSGVCTNIKRCPDAQLDIRNRIPPQLCEFVSLEPVVCCISSAATLEPPLGTSATSEPPPKPSITLEPPPRPSTTSEPPPGPSTTSEPPPRPSIIPTTQVPEYPSCRTESGDPGKCVPFYQCDANKTIITDGSDSLDIRSRRKRYAGDTQSRKRPMAQRRVKRKSDPCNSHLDTCCVVPEKPREGCGRRNPKGLVGISIGAVDGLSEFGEFPWVVAILRVERLIKDNPDSDPVNVYVGGGSLILPSVVLTTAHAVASPGKYRARAGEWDTQTLKEPFPFQQTGVNTTEIHEDYNKNNLFYNIALLFLEEPFELAPNVGLVCLPPARHRVPTGTGCFANGWGKDKFGKEGRFQTILKKVELAIVDRQSCQSTLRKTRLGQFFELHKTFMCADGDGQDTCKGDGGAPLSCPTEEEDGRYMQAGIVAWGIGCGNGTPGVYVDVAILRDWIDKKVIEKGFDPSTYSV